MKYLSWRWLLFFVVVAFGFAGSRPLGEPDEGRYAEAARELYLSGNWLLPQLQGQPHLTKPAFTYWATAAGYRLLGVNEWGARLFLSLFFLLTTLAAIELAKTWGWRRNEALASGLIFSTAVLPFAAGHLLTTDMFLTFWETLGVLSLWKVWRGAERVGLWRLLFWLAFGFAFLTKGPPGWLPLLPALAFCWLSRTRRPAARIWSLPGLLLFLLVAFSWYLAIVIQDPHKLYYFVHDEVVGRTFTDMHGRREPWWFYFFVLLAGLTPWIFLWPALLRRAWHAIRPAGTPARLGGLRPWLAAFCNRLRELEDIRLFSLLWIVIMFVIFTLAKSKMYFYIVPLFVPLALWCGRLLIEKAPALMPTLPEFRFLAYAGASLWIVFFLGFTVLAEPLHLGKSQRDLARELAQKTPQGIGTLYTLDRPSHSITFYSGLKLRQMDDELKKKNEEKKYDKLLPFLREEARQGRPALLGIKNSNLPKLADQGYAVVAKSKIMTVILPTAAPPSASATARP